MYGAWCRVYGVWSSAEVSGEASGAEVGGMSLGGRHDTLIG